MRAGEPSKGEGAWGAVANRRLNSANACRCENPFSAWISYCSCDLADTDTEDLTQAMGQSWEFIDSALQVSPLVIYTRSQSQGRAWVAMREARGHSDQTAPSPT